MLHNLDTVLFIFVNKGLSCPILDRIAPVISFLGDRITLSVILAALCVFGTNKIRITAFLAGFAFIISLIAVGSLKTLVARPRPCVVLTDARIIHKINSNDSFPSGHSAFSFAIGWVFARRHRRAFLAVLAAASLIGFSRLYLGVHYPADVISGGLLGIIIGEICLSAFRLPRSPH